MVKPAIEEEPLVAEGVMSSGVSMDLQRSNTMKGIRTET